MDIPQPKTPSFQVPKKATIALKEAEPLAISTDVTKYSTDDINCKREHKKVQKAPKYQQKKREKMRCLWEKVQKKLKIKTPVKTLSVTQGVCQFDIPGINNPNLKNGEKINRLSSIPTKYVVPEDGQEDGDG